MANVNVDYNYDDEHISAVNARRVYEEFVATGKREGYFRVVGNVYHVEHYEGSSYDDPSYTRIELWNPEIITLDADTRNETLSNDIVQLVLFELRNRGRLPDTDECITLGEFDEITESVKNMLPR